VTPTSPVAATGLTRAQAGVLRVVDRGKRQPWAQRARVVAAKDAGAGAS